VPGCPNLSGSQHTTAFCSSSTPQRNTHSTQSNTWARDAAIDQQQHTDQHL
jgi:hypothetical protein